MLKTKSKFLLGCLFLMNWLPMLFANEIEYIDTRLAFKIGKIAVTQYELEKNLRIYEEQYTKTYQDSIPSDSLKNWKRKFIDRYFFLSDADEKGYYDEPEIEKEVADVARYMLTQRYGILHKAMTKEIVQINDTDLPIFFKKRKFVYYIDYIKFDNFDCIMTLLGDSSKIENQETFERIKSKVCGNLKVHCDSLRGVWPFPPVWEINDQICEMDSNQVSDFLRTDAGVYVVYVKKKEPSIQLYEHFKKNFPQYFKFAKARWFMNRYYEKIRKKSNLKIKEDNVQLVSELIEQNQDETQLNEEYFKSIIQKKLVEYQIDNSTKNYTVADFLSFYNRQLMKQKLSSTSQIHDFIIWMVQEEFLYRDALQLGLNEEDKFLLDRKNYKNNLILDWYKKNELIIEPITEDELRIEYKQNIEYYKQLTGFVGSIFKFEDYKKAKYAIQKMDTLLKKHSINEFKEEDFAGLNEYYLHDTVSFMDTSYSKQIIQRLKFSPLGLIGPIKNDGNFIIFLKDKMIDRILPFESAKDLILNQIRKRKYAASKEKLLPSLKEKYELTIYNMN